MKYEGMVKPSSIEQDGFDPNLYAHRYTEIPSGLQMRLDYDVRTDGQPLYQGWAASGLAQGTGGWIIYKFTYDGSNNMTYRGVYGASDDDNANWSGRGGYSYD